MSVFITTAVRSVIGYQLVAIQGNRILPGHRRRGRASRLWRVASAAGLYSLPLIETSAMAPVSVIEIELSIPRLKSLFRFDLRHGLRARHGYHPREPETGSAEQIAEFDLGAFPAAGIEKHVDVGEYNTDEQRNPRERHCLWKARPSKA